MRVNFSTYCQFSIFTTCSYKATPFTDAFASLHNPFSPTDKAATFDMAITSIIRVETAAEASANHASYKLETSEIIFYLLSTPEAQACSSTTDRSEPLTLENAKCKSGELEQIALLLHDSQATIPIEILELFPIVMHRRSLQSDYYVAQEGIDPKVEVSHQHFIDTLDLVYRLIAPRVYISFPSEGDGPSLSAQFQNLQTTRATALPVRSAKHGRPSERKINSFVALPISDLDSDTRSEQCVSSEKYITATSKESHALRVAEPSDPADDSRETSSLGSKRKLRDTQFHNLIQAKLAFERLAFDGVAGKFTVDESAILANQSTRNIRALGLTLSADSPELGTVGDVVGIDGIDPLLPEETGIAREGEWNGVLDKHEATFRMLAMLRECVGPSSSHVSAKHGDVEAYLNLDTFHKEARLAVDSDDVPAWFLWCWGPYLHAQALLPTAAAAFFTTKKEAMLHIEKALTTFALSAFGYGYRALLEGKSLDDMLSRSDRRRPRRGRVCATFSKAIVHTRHRCGEAVPTHRRSTKPNSVEECHSYSNLLPPSHACLPRCRHDELQRRRCRFA